MAEEAEIFKAAMLNYQTQTAQAQEAYDNAMKLLKLENFCFLMEKKQLLIKHSKDFMLLLLAWNNIMVP